MATNTTSQIVRSGYREEKHLAIPATAERRKQGNALFSARRIRKWFGVLSTALIGTAALAPNAFGIPTALRPWVFLASIFWFFAFCTGIFDL